MSIIGGFYPLWGWFACGSVSSIPVHPSARPERIVAWGGNDCGQILIPLPDADYVALAGGHAHSLGLKSDGTVAAWGYNDAGSATCPATNVGFVSVGRGGGHSLGVKIDGTVSPGN